MNDMYDDATVLGEVLPTAAPTMTQPGTTAPKPNGPAPEGVAAGGAQPPTINDLDLYADSQEVDPDASVADMPPPLPDGLYKMRARVHANTPTHLDARSGKQLPGELISYTSKRDGSRHVAYRLWIELEHVDDGKPWHGKKAVLFADSFMRGGTSWLDDLVGAIEGKKLANRSVGQLRDHVLKLLRAEPLIGVERQWQAHLDNRKRADGTYLQDKEVIIRRGMDSFPKDAQGKPVTLTSVPPTGPHKNEPCSTRSEIVRVFAVGGMPRIGGAVAKPAAAAAGPSAVEVIG